MKNIKDFGHKILRIFSIFFLPEKYAYKQSCFCIEGIPIGYYFIFFALLSALLIEL
jgi:hypothetical protein